VTNTLQSAANVISKSMVALFASYAALTAPGASVKLLPSVYWNTMQQPNQMTLTSKAYEVEDFVAVQDRQDAVQLTLSSAIINKFAVFQQVKIGKGRQLGLCMKIPIPAIPKIAWVFVKWRFAIIVVPQLHHQSLKCRCVRMHITAQAIQLSNCY
jgi:hypothetical protein